MFMTLVESTLINFYHSVWCLQKLSKLSEAKSPMSNRMGNSKWSYRILECTGIERTFHCFIMTSGFACSFRSSIISIQKTLKPLHTLSKPELPLMFFGLSLAKCPAKTHQYHLAHKHVSQPVVSSQTFLDIAACEFWSHQLVGWWRKPTSLQQHHN